MSAPSDSPRRRRSANFVDFREAAVFGALFVVVLVAAIWLLLRLIEPSPPRQVTIATGGQTGAYYAFARRYSGVLDRAGIRLEVRPTAGSVENVRLLADAASGVDLALLQGGIAGPDDRARLTSLGRVFLEPLWVFYRATEPVDMLHQLRGKRLAIGPEGSGTRRLALDLLDANEINATSTRLLPVSGTAAGEALLAGDVDAVFLVMAPEAPLIQKLVRSPGIRLMSFAQADAYARRMPYLQRITLPRGGFDLVRNVPATDVAMIAPVAAVVARPGLHPAVAGLMIEALRDTHGNGNLFQRFGEFPTPIDPEFAVTADVERYYKAGPSFLKRYLPFWLAVFLERLMLLALPLAGIAIPMLKGLPLLYRWRIKRRLARWYARLKALEMRIDADTGGHDASVHRADVARIEAAVASTRVPLGFAEEYYMLRAAIDLVRQRIMARPVRPRAELT
jgi:TRAP transporter TAXI family solute receptor